jgi:hypothetical protein
MLDRRVKCTPDRGNLEGNRPIHLRRNCCETSLDVSANLAVPREPTGNPREGRQEPAENQREDLQELAENLPEDQQEEEQKEQRKEEGC